MSISSLISRYGERMYLWRPSITKNDDGSIAREMQPVDGTGTGFLGWIQPISQQGGVFDGRENGRTPVTIYVEGVLEVRIEDEITFKDGVSAFGSSDVIRVTGSTNPGRLGQTVGGAMNMTVIEAVIVPPKVTYGIGAGLE